MAYYVLRPLDLVPFTDFTYKYHPASVLKDHRSFRYTPGINRQMKHRVYTGYSISWNKDAIRSKADF